LKPKFRNRAAKLLLGFGISSKAELSGAVELAKKIEGILRAPLESVVLTPSQWIVHLPTRQTANAGPDDNNPSRAVSSNIAAISTALSHQRPSKKPAMNGLIKIQWRATVQIQIFEGRIEDMLLDFCK
jgi:hypothetical protein